MALYRRNQLGFKDTSVYNVTVPNNDVARLMYYFSSVCYCIDYNDSDISRYRNFQNWSSLSYNEIRVLLALCLTISPDVLDDKVFFNSDSLCGNSPNKFLEITQVSHQLMAVQSIIIAGRRCQVNKIMTYKVSWMYDNYINPIKRLAQRYNTNTSQSSSCVIS
jgi:hypothetical protein